MGDINQILFLRQFVTQVSGPILEIGSKDYGNTSSFRNIYPSNQYVGVDLEAGKGVDEVVDLTEGIGSLKENYFKLAVCCSVMEHTPKPWIMAQNITRIVAKDGLLYMSVPWVWRYHAYPDDYFRFSFRGVMCLFPDFIWETPFYSTTAQGEFIPITEENKGVDNKIAFLLDTPNGQKRKYLPYLMVNMIGRKQ